MPNYMPEEEEKEPKEPTATKGFSQIAAKLQDDEENNNTAKDQVI